MATGEIVIKLVNGELAGRTAQELSKNITACAQAAKKAEIGTQEWVKANEKLADAKALQEDYKKQIDSTAKASDGLKQSFLGILDKIPGFSAIRTAMQGATSGVGGLTSGFGLLKGAIAATGIGLLVIAVTTLVMWFSKTEAGGNVLAGVFRALGAVVNLLFGKVKEIGIALFDAFNNPKKLLNDLVQFLEDQVMNRFKAFGVAFGAINKIIHGDFKQGLKELADSAGMWSLGVANITDKVAKLGKEFGNAAAEAYNFVQDMDAIEDAQAAMEIQAKKTENQVSQLLLQAKNVGKSFEDRIALLDKADTLTRNSYADQLKLSKQYLDQINKEIDAEKKQQGVQDDTDEMRDKRKEAELKFLEIQGQGIELEEKIANRREQILGKQEKVDEKAAAAEKKRLEDEEKARLNILNLRASDQEKGLQKEIDQINASTSEKIAALVGSEKQINEQKKLLTEIGEREIQEIKDKYSKAVKEKQLKDDQEQSDLQLLNEVNSLTERFLAGRISHKKYLDDSEKAVRDSEQRKLKIIEDAQGKQSKDYQVQYKKILDQNVKFNEASAKQLAQATAAQANILGNIFGQLGALQEEGSQQQKDFMIAQAVMQTISGAIGAFMQANEAYPAPYGAIIGAAAAAVAVATGVAQINKIKGQQIPKADKSTNKIKAEYGRVLSGPSHAQGGIDIEAEGDEIVLTKGVYRDPYLRNLASQINVAGGGIKFDTGGPVNPYKDISRPPASSGNASSSPFAIDYDRLTIGLAAELNQHVENKIMKIEVHQNLQETKKGLDTIQTIQKLSNV